MSFYDEAIHRTYRFAAAAIDAGAVFGRFIGPAGKTGRVRGIEYVLTNDTDVITSLTVGVNGATAPAACTVAVAAAPAGGSMTAAQVLAAGAVEVAGVNDVELTPDTVVECASGGETVAGDADVVVSVDWF